MIARPAAVLFLGLVYALLVPGGTAFASPYTSVVVYGDSLSDNGNLYAAAALPGPPYYNGRRSDGPVAVEQLASLLGAPLVDFAWIGATTGTGNYGDGGTVTTMGLSGLPGMTTVFNATMGGLAPFVTNGLFVVWGGPNDVLAPSPADGGDPANIIARAVANEMAIVFGLQGLGATHILVPGMPDLGLTPDFLAKGPLAAAQASAFTDAFNMVLEASLPAGVFYYDTAALMRAVVADPAAYGLTNVTSPCFDGIAVCANADQYLFFDGFHPTTAADALLAAAFASAVPEPATVALMVLALGTLGWSSRTRASGSRRKAVGA